MRDGSNPRRDSAASPGRRPRALAAAAALVAALGGSAGCGTHPHNFTRTAIAREALAAPAPRAPTVLPRFARTLVLRLAEPAPPLGEALQRRFAAELRRALLATGAFERVVASEPGASAGETPAAAPALALEVTPRRVEIATAPNDEQLWAVILYLFGGPAANWVHDAQCRLVCEFDVVVREQRTRRVLARLRGLRGEARDDLSFWERRNGLWPTLATLLFVPAMVFAADEERVLALLGPRALQAPTAELARTLARLRRVELPRVQARSFPPPGLTVELSHLAAAGVPGPAGAAAPTASAVIVRLGGERLGEVERVWFGPALLYERAPCPAPLAADGARPASAGQPPAAAPAASALVLRHVLAGPELLALRGAPPVPVRVQLAGGRLLAVGEVSVTVERRIVLAAPGAPLAGE